MPPMPPKSGAGPQEARCPQCGSPLAKSPAGQQVLQKVSQAMAQKGRGGPQRPPGGAMPPGGGGGMPPRPGMPQAGAGGPQQAMKAALLQQLMQARQGGMPPQGR